MLFNPTERNVLVPDRDPHSAETRPDIGHP